ncbi:MAG: helix-turn-helix transcriptional regulator [Lachnospiraceae bacterium]|nr:helix-turn-helix transcriptional regulator [Lachnospiraceae bacterium]
MEYEQATHAEQNLLLLESAIPSDERFYIWCFGSDGKYIDSSCPETDRPLLEKAFRLFGGIDRALAYAAAGKTAPLLIGSPIGMQWTVTFETERGYSLVFVMGPAFFHPPVEDQLRAALRPYRDTLENARWCSTLLDSLPDLPVIPFAIFARYVIMTHNMLTRQNLTVSALYTEQGATKEKENAAAFSLNTSAAVADAGHVDTAADPAAEAAPAAQLRDRTKVYLAERAMLRMVRNGDINYHNALTRSSSMSPGVGVQGKEPLQQSRISVIVFTTLVCRAAMEGGLSPEIAYALGDSYIESATRSNDVGELSALAATMYHDFIYRVHHLHVNPDCSPAVQKCCDYIELSLDRRVRIADLAALTGYTEYYLTEKFKKETGMPLFLYIRKAKIERAKVLLESTDLSVRQIAEQLAFNTQNYFIKCFHGITGCTPAQYRRKFSSGQKPRNGL